VVLVGLLDTGRQLWQEVGWYLADGDPRWEPSTMQNAVASVATDVRV
jgi:hypothetical protein